MDLEARDIQPQGVRLDTHDGGHATGQCRREQVGGRETFTAALVVNGGIRTECAA